MKGNEPCVMYRLGRNLAICTCLKKLNEARDLGQSDLRLGRHDVIKQEIEYFDNDFLVMA